MWALGYQQSKWSYFPESKVKEIANEFRKRKIPPKTKLNSMEAMKAADR
jgi:alpha-glucosidase (family GH31 glycosyl hydrolase)